MSAASPSSDDAKQASLSNRQTARALRAFIISSTFWGAWGRIVGLGTAVFTGYALWLGATEAHIAYFVSIASFTSLAQVISSAVGTRFRSKKRFLFAAGMLEMLARFGVVLIPYTETEHPAVWMGALLGIGLLFGHLVSPTYNGWLASVIPEDMRGRFTARKTNAHTIAGILSGYGAGLLLDHFEATGDPHGGFLILFGLATVLGVAGYIRLMTVPYVESEPADEGSRNILAPFANRDFTRLAIFFLTWNFALGIGGPFYSVYMLKSLKLSYSAVAILNNLFLASLVVGYKTLGGLVDRFGGRAILQILIAPTALTTIMWAISGPDFYALVAVALVLNGLLHAGINTAVNALLYGVIPDGEDKATYFAAWSCAINLAYAMSPILGSFLVTAFEPYAFTLFGLPIGNIQLVFIFSGVCVIVPTILLFTTVRAQGKSTREFLAQLGRGNIFSFIYGSIAFDRTEDEGVRARAARRMGRSRNPMALGRLVEALDDASPEVRRQAARGLGEAGAQEAVHHLVEELKDEESDIRTEAAEALGKIGDRAVIDPLIEALDDHDSRIRISAIRALSDIGGDDVQELLFWKFADRFDRSTFPSLAEALAAAHDLRMVKPCLQRVNRYRSPAIRLQLFNSVTRTLGSGRRFYRMISMEPLERSERISTLLGRARRTIRRSDLHRSLKNNLVTHVDAIIAHADAGDVERVISESVALTETLVDEMYRREVERLDPDIAARIGAIVLAIRTFAEEHPDEKEEIVEVFLAVTLWSLGDALKP